MLELTPKSSRIAKSVRCKSSTRNNYSRNVDVKKQPITTLNLLHLETRVKAVIKSNKTVGKEFHSILTSFLKVKE